jgi:hypothetical protein
VTPEQREKIMRTQGDLIWLVREGYVTEFIDGGLYAPPAMVEARKKEVEAEEHDPENFPEAPPAEARDQAPDALPPEAAASETPLPEAAPQEGAPQEGALQEGAQQEAAPAEAAPALLPAPVAAPEPVVPPPTENPVA